MGKSKSSQGFSSEVLDKIAEILATFEPQKILKFFGYDLISSIPYIWLLSSKDWKRIIKNKEELYWSYKDMLFIQLKEMNPGDVEKVITKLADPKLYIGKEEQYKETLHKLNQILIYDGYSIDKNRLLLKKTKKTDPIQEVPVHIELFEKLRLHPKIVEVSGKLFKDGHYAQAIFEAFKAVNKFVKEKSGRYDLDGKGLMSTVFKKENPILKLNSLETPSDRDEQEGFMFIYMGAMVGIRNPKAHEIIVQKDPIRTLKYLALASLLLERANEAEVN